MVANNIINEVSKIVGEKGILINESMKKHTSFNIGGEADVMIKPSKVEELIACLEVIKKNEVPSLILGRGSNVIINDEGIRGIVIKLGNDFSDVEIEEAPSDEENIRVVAKSGISLKKLAELCAEQSLSGLEFAHGIPGSLGGAICMNAGAYGGEMKNVVESVKVIDNNLNIIELQNEEMAFGYRKSIIQKDDFIVVEATFKLKKRDKTEILADMDDYMNRRRSKQPLNYPSAGSVFKRPEGHYAGALIQDCGLKGTKYGGAMVSEKHAGFIVNTGNASAKDVISLIKMIQKTVFDIKKVKLEREVRII